MSDLLRLAGAFLPRVFDPWLNAYARGPGQFLAVVAVLATLLLIGSRLESRIGDTMQALWRASLLGSTNGALPADPVFRIRTSPPYLWFRRFMKSEIAPFLSAIALLYLGLTGLSHFAYNIQDDAGLVCRERDPKALAPGESKEVSFMLSDMCNNTGILLEEGVKYSSKIVATTPWKDEERDSDADGFYSSEAPTVWKRMKYILAVPLRREAIRPWFRVVARYGSAGGEEVFFDPDPITKSIDATVRATRSGELFIFVNDAVLGVPGMYDAFYRNNKGEGSATVRKL